MHSTLDFLQDLAIVMVVAGVVAVIFHRLKQPIVLGYMVAGLIIGPHTPPFPLITNEDHIRTLAELGVIFLMFRMGLHFNVRKILQHGPASFIAGIFEITLMIWLGFQLGQLFGWSKMDSVFLGALLSISSTTIIVRTLSELKLAQKPFAQTIYGILVVEDILAIAIIAFLSSFATTGVLGWGEIARVILKLSVFLVSVLIVGLFIVPKILRYVWRFRDHELFLVTILALCFGIALTAASLGYSVALGAFLIGAIVAETREAGLVERAILPLRDMFGAIFFVAVGMMIQPELLVDHAGPVLMIALAVIAGNIVTVTSGAFLAGNPPRDALRVGISLAQIGEFSFIIAQLGQDLRVTSPFLYPIAVAVSAVTTVSTPFLLRSSDAIVERLARNVPPPIARLGNDYGKWIGDVQSAFAAGGERRSALFSTLASLVIHLLLLAALFIVAGTSFPIVAESLPELPSWFGGTQGAYWLLTMVLALPLLLATFRKVSLIADALVQSTDQTRAVNRLRGKILAPAVTTAGVVLVVLWVFLLSSAFLPAWPVVGVLLVALAAIAIVGQRRLTALYHAASDDIMTTMSSNEPPHGSDGGTFTAEMFYGVYADRAAVPANSVAAGKLIRELHLRTETGATVVAIERHGEQVVNPGPDEEVRAGDVLVLLGTREQVERARHYIANALVE